MPEPSHTPAAVVISGAGAGTLSQFFGLDSTALFWAFLGALCSRAIQPRITAVPEIIHAGGYGVISTVMGTLGSAWLKLATIHFMPYLGALDHATIIALPAFLLGVLGHEVILRVAGLIREYRNGGQS